MVAEGVAAEVQEWFMRHNYDHTEILSLFYISSYPQGRKADKGWGIID